MNILVLVKQTFDTEAKISLDVNGNVDETGVNFVVNPYCEFAVEEALRIKERLGGRVTVLTVGPERAVAAIRHCFAMGADTGVIVNSSGLTETDEYTISRILAKAIQKVEYDIILAGFQAVDDGSAQVAARVADLLGIPQVTVVTKLEIESGKAIATREIDNGVETIEVALPAIFTAQQGLAEPRYPSIKGIMQAKKKPLDRFSLSDLGLDVRALGEDTKAKVIALTLPAPRKSGKIIEGEPEEAARTVVQLLRTEAKVV